MRVTLVYRVDPGVEWRSAPTVMTWTVTLTGKRFGYKGNPAWSTGRDVPPWSPQQWRWAYRNWAALNWQDVERGTWSSSPATADVNVGLAPLAVDSQHHELLTAISKAQREALDDPGSSLAAAVSRMNGYRVLLQALVNLTLPRGLLVDDLLHALLNGDERIVAEDEVRLAIDRRVGPAPKLAKPWRPPDNTLSDVRRAAASRLAALRDRLAWQASVHASPDVRDCLPDLDLMTTVLSVVRTLVVNRPTTPVPAPLPTADRSACRYLVRAGDSWWAIAERLYGEGRRFKEIQAANPTIGMLHPGDLIVVPWPAGEVTHTVATGEGFWSASRAAYGRADRTLVARIVAWNGGDDSRVLHPGDVLHCPR
jgi:nucleoid-associated protein YgaU